MPSSRRTQPYRAKSARHQSPALQAMSAGRSPLPHLAEARRRAMKKRGKRRRGRARYSSPLHAVLRVRREQSK